MLMMRMMMKMMMTHVLAAKELQSWMVHKMYIVPRKLEAKRVIVITIYAT